jgi:hypothetical protein
MDNNFKVDFYVCDKHFVLNISLFSVNFDFRAEERVVCVRVFAEHSERSAIITYFTGGAAIQFPLYILDRDNNSILEP